MGVYGSNVGWDLEFRQLDAGQLRARAMVLATNSLSSMKVAFNRRFHQLGMAPQGRLTFGLPDPECGEFRWCGVNARGGDMLNFNLDSGFEGASAAGFSGITLSFDLALFVQHAALLGYQPGDLDSLSRVSTWRVPPNLHRQLCLQLAAAYQSGECQPGKPILAATNLFNSGAAEAILEALTGKFVMSHNNPPARRSAVHRALELINDQDQLPMSVSELCQQTDVSAATLYRGFMEEVGVSPKKYLACRMLEGVRKDLLVTTPSSKIYRIANRWGFWHMGQFSADYSALFGELPSDTLARTA